MVFQSYELFPHLTVLDNVPAGTHCKVQKQPRERRCGRRPGALLGRVGLLAKEDQLPARALRRPAAEQRVAIVRALCMHPEILAL